MTANTLKPRPGFDWMRVSWGGPDEPCATTCSYCEAPLGEDDVPLMLWNERSWCAAFCTACQRRYWGLADD